MNIIIPEGWTYFTHRSNTSRWEKDPLNEPVINVNRIMSVITEKDLYSYLEQYGKTTTKGYSTGDGTPFEIRILICDISRDRRKIAGDEIKETMYDEFYYDRNNYAGVAGQRHHSVPKGEELVVLAVGNHDEVYDCPANIIWTIPRRFVDYYKQEIAKGNNRTIEINDQSKKRTQ